MNEPTGSGGLKLWHLVLVAILQFGGWMLSYGELRQEVKDLKDTVQQMQLKDGSSISNQEFNSWRIDMTERMNRLEQEILERNLGGGK